VPPQSFLYLTWVMVGHLWDPHSLGSWGDGDPRVMGVLGWGVWDPQRWDIPAMG